MQRQQGVQGQRLAHERPGQIGPHDTSVARKAQQRFRSTPSPFTFRPPDIPALQGYLLR
jgi:hypothetical protein